MHKILVTLCMLALGGACVNLQKPVQVADCEAKGGCVNSPGAGPGSDVRPPNGGATDDAGTGSGPEAGGAAPADVAGDPSPVIPFDASLPGQPEVLPDSAAVPEPDVLGDAPDVVGPAAGDAAPGARDVLPDTREVAADTADGPADTADAGADSRDTFSDVEEVPADTSDARDGPAGLCTSGGVIAPAGTVCRAAAGPCDVAEVCDGLSAECPADQLAAAGVECRAATGNCDLAETCTGVNAACPVNGFKSLGTVCRAAAGVCDVAETCSGTNAACPDDAIVPANSICRPSTDGQKCDPVERCTGTTTACPTDVIYAPPAPPTGLTTSVDTGSVTINWIAAVGADTYSVFRNSTGSATTYTFVNATSQTSYTDSTVAGGTTYYYVVTAGTGTCASGYSTQVSATTPSTCVPLAAPSGVTATAGNAQVTLTWNAVTGATQYRVSRNTTGTGTFTQIATPTAATYTNTGLTNGTTYYYVVATYNGECWSGDSTVASATPAAPTPYIIYDDALRNGWANSFWEGTTYNYSDTTPVQSGTASISVLYTGGWVGLMFHRETAVSLVGKTRFTFWAHGGATGTRSVRFTTRNSATVYSASKVISIPSGTWTKFTVTLAELGITTPPYVQDMVDISFQNNTAGAQPEFNLDQIQLE